ncbi:S-adenosylmethionine:tRNA ribosyltransferase-isomerase [uncultured Acetobacteroides sp.]|uniref:S-adenosylmethionine:tRNA ribosyltransferase-isomerase n=1 Tax=uncultured Acetobacteroides sp. TaxID=1760811 RepID=UPI0029F47764|nr:S-adenosylmethionine:tRNA ribosyltransferase-isomerase [uncultured Acetobacteroides sp.]
MTPNAQHIAIGDFNYELPDERIAKYPLSERDLSKLLYFNGNSIDDKHFKELPALLNDGDLLVFNNTKVIQARMEFFRSTGARVEIFCLEPADSSDYESVFQAKGSITWKCIVGNLKKWKESTLEKKLDLKGTAVTLTAQKLEKLNDSVLIMFSWEGEYTFSEILEASGTIPIPPYLNRDTEDIDINRYQTVYSKHKGSVAAPTAGLHFTPSIIETLKNKGVDTAEVTLHVGAGTFKPVKKEDVADHEMHTEHFSVTLESLKKLRKHLGNVISVGTTSMRTLESLYWYGVRTIRSGAPCFDKPIEQWEPYQHTEAYTAQESMDALISYLEKRGDAELHAATQIIIVSGYKVRMIKGLVTNFHQPQSTLLLLVSALVGESWKTIYNHALAYDYRFLSYGDSSLLMRK